MIRKEHHHVYVAIMAGGIGSRFWPSSTKENPKQFLDILGSGKSLLRETFDRFTKLIPKEQIYVVTHVNYIDKVSKDIPEISESQIISEPSRNNTAPGIAYTAFKIKNIDPKASLIMAPSDHVISNEESFLNQIETTLAYASEHDALVTLGIRPDRPDTGYGYIKYGIDESGATIKKVLEFKEKPNHDTALKYLKAGNYLWNSGIFIWKASTILNAFEKHAPEIYSLLQQGEDKYNTREENSFIAEYFPRTPKISVDFAIMEKADNIYVLPSDFGWSDLGTWKALYAFLKKDGEQNVHIHNKGLSINSNHNIIKTSKDKLVVIKDLSNYIIVEEEDVLLIYPKDEEQDIRNIREKLEKKIK